jgi:hypothetical protein
MQRCGFTDKKLTNACTRRKPGGGIGNITQNCNVRYGA